MTQDSTMSFRLTAAQKSALQVLARQSGRTSSDFCKDALLQLGCEELERHREHTNNLPAARSRRSRTAREFRPLSTPFLKPKDAAGFEDVIHYVAAKMCCDPITVAVLLTHLGDAIGNVLASGEVFRWPGVLVAGPYATEKSGVPCSVPRFQANPPLIEQVRWNCSVEDACNRQMDAHRRRRRKDRSGSLHSIMEIARNCYLNQDRDHLRYLEDRWREESDHFFEP